MKAAGVVVEYNPFHNGHYYHISETKRVTDADVIIAVMSGNFLQRGEPALVSKWARAQMALQGGADLVIELPYVFATQKADTFAFGAISILDFLYTDALCFGSESGNIEQFLSSIEFIDRNKSEYEDKIHEFIKTGVSYPKAVSLAFETINQDGKYLDSTKPNNILGFQYIKAIQQIKSRMIPFTIQRTGSQYHDEEFGTNNIASATSMRKSLFQSDIDSVKHFAPSYTIHELKSYQKTFGSLHNWEYYFPYLAYIINASSIHDLKNIYEMEEGLEYRLKEFINKSHSFHNFLNNIKTKRYTWTRLQRVCTHILTNAKKQTMKENMKEPNYLRVLGMSETGQLYLNHVKKKLELPLLVKASSLKNSQLEIDHRAATCFAALLPSHSRLKLIDMEFKSPPIRFKR